MQDPEEPLPLQDGANVSWQQKGRVDQEGQNHNMANTSKTHKWDINNRIVIHNSIH